MASKLLLPVTIPLRLVALQLRIARGAAGLAFVIAREVVERAALEPDDEDGDPARAAPEPPAADAPTPDPNAPAPRARRTAAAADGAAKPRSRRTGASSTPRTRPAATPPTPAGDTEPPPNPRARRTARKATAAKPKRTRASGPTRGEAAEIREAQRETEGAPAAASAGPEAGAGPEVHVKAPWPGYDEMRLDEVLDRLGTADDTLRAAVRLYESRHESRQAVLLATETPPPKP